MKSVVLLSAGLDSTVNLYQACRHGEVLLALTFDYGQRAARKEITHSKNLTCLLKIPHQVIQLSFFSLFSFSSLVNRSKQLPLSSEVNIQNHRISKRTAKAVWVPNRNGIFLNIAAGFAESLDADVVVPGFNIEEAATFPDNSRGFIKNLEKSFFYSTVNHVKVKCFTEKLNKVQIVKMGHQLGVDWGMIWPCYQSKKKWCGECESCLRSKRAFSLAGVPLGDRFCA